MDVPETASIQTIGVAFDEVLVCVEPLDIPLAVQREAVGMRGRKGVERAGERDFHLVYLLAPPQPGRQIMERVEEAGDLIVERGAISLDGTVIQSQPGNLSAAEEVVVEGDQGVAQFSGFAGDLRGERACIEILDLDLNIDAIPVLPRMDVHLAQEEESAQIALGFGEECNVESIAEGEEELAADDAGVGAGVAVDVDVADNRRGCGIDSDSSRERRDGGDRKNNQQEDGKGNSTHGLSSC